MSDNTCLCGSAGQRSGRRKGCRGVALLLVLIAVIVAGTIAYTYVGSQSTSVGVARNVRGHARARYVGETGLELVLAHIRTVDDWRCKQTQGTWVADEPFADGTFTVTVQDGEDADGDGDIDGDGDLGDDPLDPLTATVTSKVEQSTYVNRVVLRPKGRFLKRDVELADASSSFLGEGSTNYAGMNVAGVGDVNRDGYADFVIGAYANSTGGQYAGKVYLILGKHGCKEWDWERDSRLADADASFVGEGPQQYAGYSVAGAGDVNGDGFDDILIGAFKGATGPTYAGETYVIFGKAAGWSRNMSLAKADASFVGEEAYNYAGVCVAGAGDVNKDGYADFVVGAYGNSQTDMSAGKSYLVLGRPDHWAMRTNLSEADASFTGKASLNYSGYRVAGAGDVNGDGLSDFLIGAYYNSDAGTYAGAAYLIFGRTEGWKRDVSLSDADVTLLGEKAYDYASISLAGLGDVNQDGYADFAIGAYGNASGGSYAGKSYLVLGKPSGWVSVASLSSASASFIGEAANDRSGYKVAAAGDTNRDGYMDFLIGAPYRTKPSRGAAYQGQAYLILGKETGWKTNVSLADADASYWGEANYNLAGFGMEGVGDVDGDGVDDLLIGAYANSEAGSYAGQVYLLRCGVMDYDADWIGSP